MYSSILSRPKFINQFSLFFNRSAPVIYLLISLRRDKKYQGESAQGLNIFQKRPVCVMSSEPPSKKIHTMAKIGTHNGTFHCDEVLACFLLKQLDEYKDADIVRTRDQSKLDTCDIVVDVGGVYDPKTHRYDHHQRSFCENMNSLWPEKKWTIKLSSAGLVYLHFGMKVVAKALNLETTSPLTSIIYDKVYENFMEEIDAIDNGVNQTDEEPRYRISTNLSSRVAGLNPKWNESGVDENAQFRKAMQMVGDEFMDRINYYKNSWMPAREIVENALKNRHKIDPSGQIICFDQGGVPWKDHLLTLEEELEISPKIFFALFSDSNGNWRVQCVPVSLGSFENRLSLLEEWRGIRDEALSTLSGIPGCIFVHASGFIGGNKTYEGALEMAKRTLNHQQKQ